MYLELENQKKSKKIRFFFLAKNCGRFWFIFTCTEKLDSGTKKGADKKAETD
jgi:hypothetical protein